MTPEFKLKMLVLHIATFALGLSLGVYLASLYAKGLMQ